jgi:hypothetical protein
MPESIGSVDKNIFAEIIFKVVFKQSTAILKMNC